MSKPIPLFIFGKENNVDAVYLYLTNTKQITFDWYPYGPDSKDNTKIKGTFKKFEKVNSQTGGAPADEGQGAEGPAQTPGQGAEEGAPAAEGAPGQGAEGQAPAAEGQTPGLDAEGQTPGQGDPAPAAGPPEGQAQGAAKAQDAAQAEGESAQTPGQGAAPVEGAEEGAEAPAEGPAKPEGESAAAPAAVSEAEPIIYGNKFTYTKSEDKDKWTLEYKKEEEGITYKLLCDNKELFYVIQKDQTELTSKFNYTDLKFDNFK